MARSDRPENRPDRTPRPRGRARRWLRRRSLAERLAALLTLALVPLGLLAVEQTRRAEAELERVRSLNFHALTSEIAQREASTLDRLIGMAEGLAVALPALHAADPAACSARAAELVAGDRDGRSVSFIGFTAPDGALICASAANGDSLADDEGFAARMEARQRFLLTRNPGAIGGEPVVAVNEPVFTPNGTFSGFVSLSVPARDIVLPEDVSTDDIAVALVDSGGIVLGGTESGEALARRLPADFEPSRYSDRQIFETRDRSGTRGVYAVEPIRAGLLYAVGIEPPVVRDSLRPAMATVVYPLLMWLASIALVLLVLESSLMLPVRSLGARLRRFGATREVGRKPLRTVPLPRELAVIEDSFAEMASQLKRDEARLHGALDEQRALTKEVHHRVKNNLQFIASMINLQMRSAGSSETEAALARINGRITSLAAVHRQLYGSESVGRVPFDTLLRDVVLSIDDMARPGAIEPDDADRPNYDWDLEPTRLTADDALPAAMFAAEAVTNAIKFGAAGTDGRRWIRLQLKGLGQDGSVRLAVESSGLPADETSAGAESAGGTLQLGRKLLGGFARQLRGRWDARWKDGIYVAEVVFRPRQAAAAASEDRAAP